MWVAREEGRAGVGEVDVALELREAGVKEGRNEGMVESEGGGQRERVEGRGETKGEGGEGS